MKKIIHLGFFKLAAAFMALVIVFSSCTSPYDSYSGSNNNNETGQPDVREPVFPYGDTVAGQLLWIQNYGTAGGYYIVRAYLADEIIDKTHVIGYGRRHNITVRILGQGIGRTLSLGGPIGAMFLVEQPEGNVTLVLENITLMGHSNNTSALVEVNRGGALEMRAYSVITGNTLSSIAISSSLSAGIYVRFGTITMRDNARIHNNHGNRIGGVALSWNSILTMRDNASIKYNHSGPFGSAGGVSAASGQVFMYDNAAIHGNTADSGTGGIVLQNASLNMLGNNVRISGNSGGFSGGVTVSWFGDSMLNISGGTIFGSVASPELVNTGTVAALNNLGVARVVSYTASPIGHGTFVPSTVIPSLIPSTSNTITVRDNGTYAAW